MSISYKTSKTDISKAIDFEAVLISPTLPTAIGSTIIVDSRITTELPTASREQATQLAPDSHHEVDVMDDNLAATVLQSMQQSSSSQASTLELPQGGSTPPEGQQFSTDVPNHSQQQPNILICLEETSNVQHGDMPQLGMVPNTRVIEAVDAHETLREARGNERQRTEDRGKLIELLYDGSKYEQLTR